MESLTGRLPQNHVEVGTIDAVMLCKKRFDLLLAQLRPSATEPIRWLLRHDGLGRDLLR